MQRLNSWILLGTLAVPFASQPATAGILGPPGDSPDEKRAQVRGESGEMLAELYQRKPELRERISRAPGYATFSMLNMNLFLMASGNGYGLLKDNRTGGEIFMRMASLGAGAGMGVKDFRAVFLFNDAEVMERFVEQGWQFGAQADAGVKAGGEGMVLGESAAVDTGGRGGISPGAGEVLGVGGPMEIYQITDTGIALQVVVSGTKYWPDGKLND
jgi:hypothetical protein